MTAPKHVAVASALSPRFRAVLAEGWRFARHFGAHFSVLHAGEQTPGKNAQLHDAIGALGLPSGTRFDTAEGEPAATLIELAEKSGVDLLVAGALERDVEMHFLSGVARSLLRDLHCSLALFTEPREDPQPFRRIVVITDFSDASRDALRLALRVAEAEGAEVLHVLSVFTPFSAALEDKAAAEEEEKLDAFVRAIDDSPVPIDARVVHSTTGMGAADFAKTMEADLLVVPAGCDAEGRTQLPAYMDWIVQVIPCNLWVVKQPKTEA